MSRQFVSIAAAPGWAASFESDDGSERVVTLLAWALVEEDDHTRSLVGLVQRPRSLEHPAGQVALADEVEGFTGYIGGALQTRPMADRPE